MKHTPLDTYDMIPPDMRAYLANYGWHFNKKACDFAVGLMRDKDGKITPYIKSQVEELLKLHQITLNNDVSYDSTYVANMCKAYCLSSSVPDEKHLAHYVKDTIDNVDAADGTVMRCWYASMVAAGIPVEWSELL